MLGRAAADRTALLMSMLVGNNLTHYLATSIVTVMLLTTVKAEHTAELFATLITAPALFVFSELIPKNIFFHRADSLMPFFSPFLFVFHKLFTWSGIVPILKGCSGLFARFTGTGPAAKARAADVRSPYISALLQETGEEALLSPVQMQIISRTAAIATTRIGSVMTPVTKLQTVEHDCDNSFLFAKLQNCPFTRLPVTRGRPDNIIGFINIYDCLSSDDRFTDLADFIKPIRRLSTDVTVADAISIMQRENQKIVLVTRRTRTGQERPLGIVTMKDLIEELLGELTEW
jgi:CBS domain containing-hemolysin-like protein